MISFFSKKPLLKELIPQESVDFHSHILYGLDDGAKTKEDTVFLIDSLKEIGFSKLITTPHTTPMVWDNTKEAILSQYEKIKTELPELSADVGLHTASEYLMDESFLQRLNEERLLTLKEDYVLVEMSYINPPIELFDILFQLANKGYRIVLAHPERYNFYHNDFDVYNKLKEVGCLFQLNLLSSTGYYGDSVAQTADKLLKEKMYDFAATDAHHAKHINAFGMKVTIKNHSQIPELLENNSIFK